ncbi:hypothetical protein AGMMS50230_06000 [Spirochaetia bacterium]|nr:hypothetical protein AGMMS50230_06000 [Spirochaetia bacterium]
METIQSKHRELSSIALFKSIGKLGLEEAQVEKLVDLLLRNARSRTINTRDITREVGIPLAISAKILIQLSDDGVISLDPYRCPQCDALVSSVPEDGRCQYCDGNLSLQESLSVSLSGNLDTTTDRELSRRAAANRSAQKLANAWAQHGYIYYLVLDLVASQPVQNELKDDGYDLFLKNIRDIVKYKIFPHINGAVLSFGEVGDMHKVGFENSEDVIEAVRLLSKNLPPRPVPFKEDIYFPCYSGSITKIELPTNKDGHPYDANSLISTTINGVPDINSIALTNFYRYDAVAKTSYSVYKDTCDISLWYFIPDIQTLPDEIAGLDFSVPQTAWKSFFFCKNGITGKNNAICIYIKNGTIAGVESDPDKIT